MKSSGNQIRSGAVLTYIRLACSVLIGVFYTPVMIRLLGQSEYGLYNSVASVTAMLSVLNLGFSSGYQRYYAKYKKQRDEGKIAKLNGMFMSIFLVIAAVAAVCGAVLSVNLETVFGSGLTTDEYSLAKILFVILMVQLVISFPMNVFTSILQAHERYVFSKLLTLAKTVLGPMLTLPLLLLGYRSVAMVAVSLAVSVVTDVVCIYYVFFVLHEKFRFGGMDKEVYSDLFVYTLFIGLHLLTDQINWNVDKVILGRFCGTAVVAVYSVGYSLYSYFLMIGTPISTLYIPRIHQIAADTDLSEQKRGKALTSVFISVGRKQYLILACVVSGIIIFGRQFISLWVGDVYRDSYWVALLLIVPGLVGTIQCIGTEIQRALNLHRFRGYISIAMALLNVIISIPLCLKFGAVGSAMGTALSAVVVYCFINVHYHKKCNVDIGAFWKSILSVSKGLILPIILGIVIISLFALDSWLFLAIGIVAYIIVYALSMWSFGMNGSEKATVKSMLGRFLPFLRKN